MTCPDPELCKAAGRHIHGKLYERYKQGGSPSLLEKGIGFLKAVASHVKDRGRKLSLEETRKRLDICDACPEQRPHNVCRLCGCNLALKASWASESCPIGKWLAVPASSTDEIKASGTKNP